MLCYACWGRGEGQVPNGPAEQVQTTEYLVLLHRGSIAKESLSKSQFQ